MVGTPIRPVEMARDAAVSMTEEQRVAFAIELVAHVSNPHCALQLARLANVATDAQTRIVRAQFLSECG